MDCRSATELFSLGDEHRWAGDLRFLAFWPHSGRAGWSFNARDSAVRAGIGGRAGRAARLFPAVSIALRSRSMADARSWSVSTTVFRFAMAGGPVLGASCLLVERLPRHASLVCLRPAHQTVLTERSRQRMKDELRRMKRKRRM